ncbi:MAG: DNA alkylation repair protein [Candidatus Cloacimonas sp.]|jgi:3-methyladenine DNA glycosylase AlkD|nr:DNA alkylation repair protein [Candidatus Cloacimonas sp.]
MSIDLDPRFKTIIKTVENYCLDYEDPSVADKYAYLYPEGYDAFGLEEEQVLALRDVVLKNIQFNVEETAELAWRLFATGKYEYGSVAILLLKHVQQEFNRAVFDFVRRIFDSGVENWVHADALCTDIIPVFLEKKIVTMDDFIPWRMAKSKWTRRAVPVSMLALVATKEPQELLDFIDPMMRDEAKVVQEGLGLLLREIWKLHPQNVDSFLQQHKQHCASQIIQTATEKMSSEQKNRYNKDKNHKKNFKNPRKPERKPVQQEKKVTKSSGDMYRGKEMLTPKPKAPHPNKVKS